MRPLSAGERVGNYVLEGLLAEGGMGAVWLATHSVLSRRAAIKVLHGHLMDARTRQRVLEEARILETIAHPSVVNVFDAGELPDGRPWIAMELLEGETLGDHVDRSGPLPVDEAIDILIAIADVLAAAHEVGVVHRDVKPDNVMLVAGAVPHVKVIDWGIARADTSPRLTDLGTTPGTPQYMSPEQVRGLPVDARTDVYALGVVAYEVLTGTTPFRGANSIEVAVQHVTVMPRPCAALRPAVPPALDQLVLHMLDKQPAHRPTLGAIRDRLAALRAVAPCDEELWPECELELEIELDFQGPTEPALPVLPRPLLRWTPPIGPAAASASIAAAIERCLDEADRARGDVRRGTVTLCADLDACVTGEIAATPGSRPLH